MKRTTFSVKSQLLELNEKGLAQTKLISLGENLSWQQAVELRKENRGSWSHPENASFQDPSKRVFVPDIVIGKSVVKKHRVRSK